MYAEETDWCYRFKKSGWKIIFTPVAEIIRLGGASSLRIASDMILQLRGSILCFIAKHHAKSIYILACIFIAFIFAVRLPFWLIKAIVSPRNQSSCRSTAKVYSNGLFRL